MIEPLLSYYCTICLWTRHQTLALMTARSPSKTWHHLCYVHYIQLGGKYSHPYPCKVNQHINDLPLFKHSQEK